MERIHVEYNFKNMHKNDGKKDFLDFDLTFCLNVKIVSAKGKNEK